MTSPKGGSSSALSWYDARNYCNSYNADLATIHTTDENQFIFNQVSTYIRGNCYFDETMQINLIALSFSVQ